VKKNSFKKSFSFSWKALVIFAVLTCLWHLPLIWVKDKPNTAKQPIRVFSEERQLVYHREIQASSEETPAWHDPTIYLLPSRWSFSSYRNRKLAPPTFTGEQLAPPQVVQEFEPTRSGELSTSEALSLASSSAAQTSENSSKSAINDLSEKGSSWRITGEQLATRLITASSAFPKTKFEAMPQITTLRLGVSYSGEVTFVVVDKGSGIDAADDLAVRFAKTLRFAPKDSSEAEPVSWGLLKIDWRQNSSAVLSENP
jgi:hypothetical protein